MRTRHRAWSGFTLVELLLAMVIMLAGSGVALMFLRHEGDFMEFSTLQGDVRTRSQLALHAVATELRAATRKAAGSPPNIVIPAAPANTSLTLYKPGDLDADLDIVDNTGAIEWDEGTSISYQYDAAAQRLNRVAGGVTRTVAHHVTSVTFKDATMDAALAADEVRVSLTLQETTARQRDVNATASTVVKLRN